MYGWTGRALRIDLSTGSRETIEIPSELYESFLGGKGLAGCFLKDFVTSDWDSPEMPLLLFTGPLVNTPSPTSGRMTFMSRSPLSGTIADSSVGGKLGVRIKKAGWDGIIITGAAKKMSGIEITDDKIEIHDAESLRGLKTGEATRALTKKGFSTAVIGPAAENACLYANIVVDYRYFVGRNGLGAVMAAKNLKYLRVGGTGKTLVKDPDALGKAREEIFRLIAASPILKGEFGIGNFGTGAIYDLIHHRRMMPTNNFQATRYEPASGMNAWAYKERYGDKKSGCAGCHILCKRNDRDRKELPEFETMAHFSALIENDNLDAVVSANRLCSELGVDTISAAATLACHREVSGEDLPAEKIYSLLNDIAFSRGIGAELKLGSFRYAAALNRPECAMTVKKQEFPAYDPRGAYGMALAYVTSTRAACHLRAYPIAHEILRKPVVTDRFTFSGKARIIKISEDVNAVVDSLTACKFVFFAATLEEFSKAYQAVTGIKSSAQDLLDIGERIYYQERMMNCLNGFSSKDDDLPERFFSESGSSGESVEIKSLDREEFLQTRANYYKVRGLDEDGKPTKEKCLDLGLEIICSPNNAT